MQKEKRQQMLKTKAQTADVSLILRKRSFNVVEVAYEPLITKMILLKF